MQKLLAVWHKSYCVFVPTVIIIAMILGKYEITKICDSELYDDMLASIITFLSVVISVFGVLLPSLISAKQEEAVKSFLKNIDIELFSKNIRHVVLAGIFEVLLTAVLFMYGIMPERLILMLLYLWIWLLCFFSCSTYRFISIIISVLLKTKGSRNSSERKVAHPYNPDNDKWHKTI